MADTLHFRGQQIGDHFVQVEGADQLLTPPVRREGLFQDRAVINTESRNLVNTRVFSVSLKRDTPIEFDQAVSLISELQGLRGDVEVRQGGTPKMRCTDWVFEQMSPPNVLPGFGGRFTPALRVVFSGESSPQYF